MPKPPSDLEIEGTNNKEIEIEAIEKYITTTLLFCRSKNITALTTKANCDC